MAVYYDSTALYLQSKKSIIAKIEAIELIIAQLMVVAATAAETDHITEYSLDDGQTIIKATYSGTDHVLKSIEGYEKLLNQYRSKLNGRRRRLIDRKSFR